MAPARQGTLILSPHADDAALSLGGSIAAGLLPGPVRLVTVFGRSGFSVDSGPEGDPERVSAMRRAEEEEYARRHGLDLIWLGHEDATLRHGWPATFVAVGESASPVPAADAIVAAAREVGAALVLAPLGLGRHADHLVLRELAPAIAGDAALGYYEDLPYAARLSTSARSACALEVDARLVRIELRFGADRLADKLEDLEIYRSQLGARILRAVRSQGRKGTETLWASPAAYAMLGAMLDAAAARRLPC